MRFYVSIRKYPTFRMLTSLSMLQIRVNFTNAT